MIPRRFKILTIVLLIIIIAALFVYQYLINIYEVTVLVEPKELFADNQSQLTIMTIPLNSMGRKAWFREAPAEFNIKEGKDLIEIVLADSESGVLMIKSKSNTGIVILEIKSKYSLLPILVEITIYPNYT